MANQTELLNVSDEMKYNDNVQMDNVKEQEENMYSFSSDTTEELCSSQATDACRDGCFTFQGRNRLEEGSCGVLIGGHGYVRVPEGRDL